MSRPETVQEAMKYSDYVQDENLAFETVADSNIGGFLIALTAYVRGLEAERDLKTRISVDRTRELYKILAERDRLKADLAEAVRKGKGENG